MRHRQIVRLARGRYALPVVDEAQAVAHRLAAVTSHGSAAAYYGWEMKHPPRRPAVTVARTRRIAPERRKGVEVHWLDLPPGQVWNGVTTPLRTVIDCAKTLPFDEALAIADSALRHSAISKAELLRAAQQVRSTGRAQCLRVAHAASGLADNPFESVLRAIALDVPGLHVEPQVVVPGIGRPDLVDEARRLVIEADSFEFHGNRRQLTRDCKRYNAFVIAGWVVLRFSWEQVMFQPAYVAACLRAIVNPRAAA